MLPWEMVPPLPNPILETDKRPKALLFNYNKQRLAYVYYDDWHGWIAYGYVDKNGNRQNAKCIFYGQKSLKKAMQSVENFYTKQDYRFLDPKLENLL